MQERNGEREWQWNLMGSAQPETEVVVHSEQSSLNASQTHSYQATGITLQRSEENPDQFSAIQLPTDTMAFFQGRTSSESKILGFEKEKSRLYVHLNTSAISTESSRDIDTPVHVGMPPNSARVLIWNKREEQFDGHVAMILRDSASNYHMIGLYAEGLRPDTSFIKKYLGFFKANFKDGYFTDNGEYPIRLEQHPQYVIEISDLNLDNMLEYYNDFANHAPKWRALGDCCSYSNGYHNCSSLCYEMLKKGGFFERFNSDVNDSFSTKLQRCWEHPENRMAVNFTKSLLKTGTLFGLFYLLFHFGEKPIEGKNASTSTEDQLEYSALLAAGVLLLVLIASCNTFRKRLLDPTEGLVTPVGLKSFLLEKATNPRFSAQSVKKSYIKLIEVEKTLDDILVIQSSPQPSAEPLSQPVSV